MSKRFHTLRTIKKKVDFFRHSKCFHLIYQKIWNLFDIRKKLINSFLTCENFRHSKKVQHGFYSRLNFFDINFQPKRNKWIVSTTDLPKKKEFPRLEKFRLNFFDIAFANVLFFSTDFYWNPKRLWMNYFEWIISTHRLFRQNFFD